MRTQKSQSKPSDKPIHHNDVLRSALLKLIEIYVPSHFKNQAEMAEALDIQPAIFYQLKNGHKNIGKSTIEKIEKGLNLGITGFYKYANAEFVGDETLNSLASRYTRSNEAVKALVDLSLSNKKPPSWMTKSILILHKGLIELIGEEIKRQKKKNL